MSMIDGKAGPSRKHRNGEGEAAVFGTGGAATASALAFRPPRG
jgi:hypothetical protein